MDSIVSSYIFKMYSRNYLKKQLGLLPKEEKKIDLIF